ncbi:hypothetical protein [Candidatus Methylospira mobilis]
MIEYRKTLWLCSAFIIASGTTHLVSIFLFWPPLCTVFCSQNRDIFFPKAGQRADFG